MTHLLDTDHLSLLQYDNSPEQAAVVLRINLVGEANVVATVVSFHEQMRGAHAQINASRTPAQVVKGYALMSRIIADYGKFEILPFDTAAAAVFDVLNGLKLGVKTMDLRIAAIARSRNLTVVTRNLADFGRVPNLKTEDWTK
jgi:tRNA(fMet)-specific endonuclease VapC